MSDRISLVRWRPVTDPPKGNQDRQVWVQPSDGSAPCAVGAWMVVAKPESFSRWCDPSPPGDDALTVDHLRRIRDLAAGMHERMMRRPTHFNGDIELEIQEREQADGVAIARLRRAIEEAER